MQIITDMTTIYGVTVVGVGQIDSGWSFRLKNPGIDYQSGLYVDEKSATRAAEDAVEYGTERFIVAAKVCCAILCPACKDGVRYDRCARKHTKDGGHLVCHALAMRLHFGHMLDQD